MNFSPRQSEILQAVRDEGFVSVEALAAHYEVSPQTIRRDINTLCDHGLLRRQHGGAALPVITSYSIHYTKLYEAISNPVAG